MTESEIIRIVTGSFAGVDVLVASGANGAPEVAWGDTFFFYTRTMTCRPTAASRSQRS